MERIKNLNKAIPVSKYLFITFFEKQDDISE